MLLPYLDQLDPDRQKIFKQLKFFSKRFRLAGGTAIMLQIGHRFSYDFDCFSQKPLEKNLLLKAKQVFGVMIAPQVNNRELCLIKTPKGIEIHFVYHPYQPLKKSISTCYILLEHLDDLVANKAYTIGRRGAWRDYVDLFFFLKWKLYDIDKIIRLTEKKFAGEFNEKLFLEQLVYYDDLDIIPTTFLKESYAVGEIKSFLENQVELYVKKTLKI